MKNGSTTYWRLWIATLVFFAGFYALLAPLPRYLVAIGLADWEIGLVLGGLGVASLIGRPLAGVAVDRVGARRVLLAGAGALLCGALGVPATASLWALLGLRLAQALGYVAFTTAGSALVVALTPPALLGRRLAVFGTAANLAITLTPAAIGGLLTLLPLGAGFAVAGALALLAGLIVLPRGGLPAAAPAPVVRRPPAVLWPPMLFAALFGAGFAAFFQFAPVLAERRGDVAAGWLYAAYGAGIIATRLASGRLLVRAASPPLLCSAVLSLTAGLGLCAAGLPPAGLLLAALLIAGGSGILHPALLARHAALLPATPGQATAAFYLAFDAGIGLGSWLFGGLLERWGLSGLYAGAALLMLLTLPLSGGLPRAGRAW